MAYSTVAVPLFGKIWYVVYGYLEQSDMLYTVIWNNLICCIPLFGKIWYVVYRYLEQSDMLRYRYLEQSDMLYE